MQELFDPVAFSDDESVRDTEALAYINFTKLLNEAEGMSSSLVLTFIITYIMYIIIIISRGLNPRRRHHFGGCTNIF